MFFVRLLKSNKSKRFCRYSPLHRLRHVKPPGLKSLVTLAVPLTLPGTSSSHGVISSSVGVISSNISSNQKLISSRFGVVSSNISSNQKVISSNISSSQESFHPNQKVISSNKEWFHPTFPPTKKWFTPTFHPPKEWFTPRTRSTFKKKWCYSSRGVNGYVKTIPRESN